MAFSFIKLISSSDTLTKREAVILKICPPAITTSAEVIIAEYDAILRQWERENFYDHLGNYTKIIYCYLIIFIFIINLLLTERQYSPVRFELARLVSSLLYGTRLCLFVFC